MNRRLGIALMALVLLPVGALGWLGARTLENEAERVEASFAEVVRRQLHEDVQRVAFGLDSRERELLALAEALPTDAADMRAALREHTWVRNVLVADDTGRLLFPPPEGPVTADERVWLERTRVLWQANGLVHLAEPRDETSAPKHGWKPWYGGTGLQLLFWSERPDGRVIGIGVGRVRLLADIVRWLPSTGLADDDARTALVEADGVVVYQWGAFEPEADVAPRVTVPLASPLAALALRYDPAPGTWPDGQVATLGFGAVIAALGLAVVGLATYFYRESTRELRTAAQRVTFVNQVSHELKTPLTNIRMYAELLEQHLDDEDEKATRYLQVLVKESQRLSRLITNVLSFARKERTELVVCPVPGVVDEIVASVVEQFEPSLREHGVELDFERAAPARVAVDRDALEQMLGNLLGNVLKYAPNCGAVEVRTQQQGARTQIHVADHGPGVPRASTGRIFEPFYRASDRLADGVAGTGIGLTLARDLARLHGGDLELVPAPKGAHFVITLATPGEEALP